jgi:hypothetical protein
VQRATVHAKSQIFCESQHAIVEVWHSKLNSGDSSHHTSPFITASREKATSSCKGQRSGSTSNDAFRATMTAQGQDDSERPRISTSNSFRRKTGLSAHGRFSSELLVLRGPFQASDVHGISVNTIRRMIRQLRLRIRSKVEVNASFKSPKPMKVEQPQSLVHLWWTHSSSVIQSSPSPLQYSSRPG